MANEPLFSAFKPGELKVEPEKVETAAVEEVNSTETPAEVTAKTAETTTAETTETAAATAEVKEVIKEVEKIVEKYPEMDEYTKEVFDALMAGKEDVLLNFLSEKNKDYKTMSDYDVVKEALRKANPSWTSDDIDIKIEVQYGELSKINLSKIDKEENPEEYADAELHNKTVERNLKLLKLDALDARDKLEAAKKDIKLPKTAAVEQPVNNEPSPEALAQAKADWTGLVDKEIPELKEFTFKVGNKEEGHEDVVYKVTDAERKAESGFFRELTPKALFERLGWVDANGKQNVLKMAGDVLKLERAEKIAAAAYTQGKTAGTKRTVEDIKNIDLSKTSTSSVAGAPIDIGVLGFGHLNP